MSRLASLKKHAPTIDKHIGLVFSEFRAELGKGAVSNPLSYWAFETMQKYVMGPGKRLRGALALELFNEQRVSGEADAGLWLAASIELAHGYLLAVDDVMDKSPLRRGQPTVHEMYKMYNPDLKDDFEADMVAINVGLMLQHMSAWASAKAVGLAGGGSPTQVLLVSNRYLAITGLGQLDDIMHLPDHKTTVSDILDMYRKKSSFYTFVNPLASALALAGTYDENTRQEVEDFGLPAGVAFQLRDDWLGIFGDTTQSGKENLDDVKEGKRTFLVRTALDKAREEDVIKLNDILGDTSATSEDLSTVRRIMTETGAVVASDEMMRNQAEEAQRAAVQARCWSPEFGELLQEVVQYSVGRLK